MRKGDLNAKHPEVYQGHTEYLSYDMSGFCPTNVPEGLNGDTSQLSGLSKTTQEPTQVKMDLL